MSKKNPTGRPLSGPRSRGAVTYRPRIGKRRPRLRVPEEVAEKLEDDAERTTDVRRRLAQDAAADRKEKRAKKPASSKRKPGSKAAKPRKPKPRTPKAPKAPKVPPAVMAAIVADMEERLGGRLTPVRKARPKKATAATVKKALGVSASEAKAIVACAADTPKQKRKPRAKKETTQGDLFAKINPTRAPVNLADLQVASFLGNVVSLRWDTADGYREEFKATKPIQLLWAPEADCAFFFARETRTRPGQDIDDRKARSVVERGTGRKAGKTSTIVVPELKKAPWKKVGKGHSIVYRSNRAGPMEKHEHDLGPTVSVYVMGSLWVIRGGKLRVTSRGLEG